jgi:two-component system nitrate/nitrite response regulator NarL
VKTKVVLAEDHPAMRAMLAKILLREFEIVADVESGAAAVEAASTMAPDVIVVDVRMPVVDGIEVARRLKEQGCKAKIIFVSVSESANQVNACFRAGGDAYVSKLRMASDLVYAVKRVLGGETFVSSMETVMDPPLVRGGNQIAN